MAAGKVNVRWVPHPELSAAHAAYVVATGAPCVDEKTEQQIVQAVTDINNRLLSYSIDVSQFWKRYLVESLNAGDVSAACSIALMASGCNELQLDQTTRAIAGRLRDTRSVFAKRFPKLKEQLELRAGPLRDKWDTYGQGLLRDIGRQVWEESPPSDWWMSRITGLMIQPMRGGDGGFDSDSETFWIEAMLTDVDPDVPEVLRVAWLITRVAIDRHTRNLTSGRALTTPWSLVSVPLVLTAATNLELIRPTTLPIQRAMEMWRIGDAAVAQHVADWWQHLQQAPVPLPIALKTLQETLEGTPRPESGN